MTEFIYAIRAGDTDRVKIGRSSAPLRRLASLQSGCADELKLIAVAPHVEPNGEASLHEAFSPAHIRGEWFAVPPNLDGLIRDIFASIEMFYEASSREEQLEVVAMVAEWETQVVRAELDAVAS